MSIVATDIFTDSFSDFRFSVSSFSVEILTEFVWHSNSAMQLAENYCFNVVASPG